MSKWNLFKKEERIEERWILSIDGGGIRGIIPTQVLLKLQELLKEKGDERPLYSHFDLIAGTSTGGIIAAALSSPITENTLIQAENGDEVKVFKTEKRRFHKPHEIYRGSIPRRGSLEQIQNIYLNNGKDIFEPKMKLFGALFAEKYNERTLEYFFHRAFQSSVMEDLLVPTVIVAFDTISGDPYLFTSYNAEKEEFIRNALRATSAAPMYFAPVKKGNCTLIDGGVVANNPSLIAYSEAKKLYPNCKKFHIVSLSTLSPKLSIDVTDIIGGLAGWAEPITKIYTHAQYGTINQALESASDVEYLRLYKNFKGEKIKLDDIRPDSINKLLTRANDLIEEKSDELDYIATQLSQKEISEEFPLTKMQALEYDGAKLLS